VWITDFGDGRLCLTTEASSLKAKRIGNDNRVLLQPSNARGSVSDDTEPVSGAARIAGSDTDDFTTTEAAIKAKYGFQVPLAAAYYKIINLFGSKSGSGTADAAVVITLD